MPARILKPHAENVKGKALLSESRMAQLGPPPIRTFDAVRHASTRFNEAANHRDPIFGGHSATLYKRNDDLVLLKYTAYEDRVTTFVQQYLPVLFLVRTTQFLLL